MWGVRTEFYLDVFNLFNHKNMTQPDGYRYDTSSGEKILTGVNGNWAWNDHRWWKDEFVAYMNSLNIDAGDRPGDYRTDKKKYIEIPGFSPWTFLEKVQHSSEQTNLDESGFLFFSDQDQNNQSAPLPVHGRAKTFFALLKVCQSSQSISA